MNKMHPANGQHTYLLSPNNNTEEFDPKLSKQSSQLTWSSFQLILAIIGIGLTGGLMLGLSYSLFLGLYKGITLGLLHGLVGGSLWAMVWYLKWAEE